MAVKVATRLTLSREFLAEALAAKETPLYRNQPRYKGYSYEENIYPEARFAFRKYNTLYKTNQDFSKYFARDLYHNDPQLLEQIQLAETLVGSQAPISQEVPAEQQTVGMPSMPTQGVVPTSRQPRLIVIPKEAPAEAEKAETMISKTEEPSVKQPAPTKVAPIKEQSLKFQSGWRSTLKTGLSNAGIFLRQNGGRILNGLRGMAGSALGGATKSGGNLLASGLKGNFPGRGAISGNIGGIRNAAGSARSGLVNVGKSRAKWVILIILLFGGIFGLINISNPTGQPVSTAPITGGGASSDYYGLDYTLPLKDPSIVPLDIKNQVVVAFPGAKLEYWENIIKRSVEDGLNPAVSLGLWIEETGASQTTIRANGGSEIPTPSGEVSLGHLGCAPWENQTINESLDCLFKFIANNKYTNDQFAQFMAKYSGGPESDPFSNNQDFTKNFKKWYLLLAPGSLRDEVPTAVASPIASCPVPNGVISTPSYQAGRISGKNNGHCDESYDYTCHCGTEGRRAKAIDVPTNGKNIQLPTINNERVNWTLIDNPYEVKEEDGGGFGYTFLASQGGDSYYLDMLHLGSSAMYKGTSYPSGEQVATSVIGHVHMTMGKNLKDTPVASTKTDCDPNWLPSDFMCL